MAGPVKIGLLGLGTVGSGVAQILQTHGQRLAERAGLPLQIERVVVRDPERARRFQLPRSLLDTRVESILDDPQIEIVIELVGGVEGPWGWVEAALRSGKDVVTANKALLAERGRELFPLARSLGRVIACEGAVASGIPVIATLRQSLTANAIHSICGILNGTSNFVLNQLEARQTDLYQALDEAKALGFAELDANLDIDGSDAAQKLAILAQLAFGVEVHWRDIPRQGIDGIRQADIVRAQQAGCRIRPLACAVRVQEHPSTLNLFVAPTLVPESSPLADTRGAENAVLIEGDAIGRLVMHGSGAGQLPTASAVVGDIVDIVTGRAQIADNRSPLWPASLPRWKPDPRLAPTQPIAQYPLSKAE
jgi:homoserine dehydrogenase